MHIPRTLLIICLLIYTALISYLSLKPMDSSATFQIWDKAAHAIAYIGFAIQSSLIAKSSKQVMTLYSFFFTFGVTIELLQGMTTYRFASWEDQLANMTGLLLGYLAFNFSKYFFAKKPE